MSRDGQQIPTLISLVGVDGSGKSTMCRLLAEELARRGYKSVLVWSRFRNYLSKPLLALTRLSGHNYYRTIDGVRFGFHNFERLPVYRELFALLQAIDVNIAAYARIQRMRKRNDVVLSERGPWDTLVDVAADTGLSWLPGSRLGSVYTMQMTCDAQVLWISRDQDAILQARPELKHDRKLLLRITIYEMLAEQFGWDVIDNNDEIESTMAQIRAVLRLDKKGT